MDIDPVRISLPKNVWTPIDKKVNSVRLNKIDNAPSAYYYIYLEAESPAPIDGDLANATLAFQDARIKQIEVAQLVDIYMTTTGRPGEVSYENMISKDVFVQDQTTPPFDFYFLQAKGAPTTLTNDVAINDTSMIVDDITNFVIDDYVGVFSGVSLEGRYYFAEVVNIIGNEVFLDTPFDFAFEAGDPVISSTRDMNVDGSVTKQIFSVTAGGVGSPLTIDITRIMISITTLTPPDFLSFGDLPALTNGLVLRRKDGIFRNIWNIDTNKDIANLSYDYTTYLAGNQGQGINGIAARYTLAGPDKHGVVVRLNPGDAMETIIQDNLSGLTTFRMIAQGHQVQ